MTQKLKTLCESLQSALQAGDIGSIPRSILQIKQILSRNADFIGGEAEIKFDKLSKDLNDLKIILEAIKSYMTWISKLKSLDMRALNDGSEAFEVLVGEINLPLVWDYSVDPIFIDAEYEYKQPLIEYLTKNHQQNIFTFSKGKIFDVRSAQTFAVYDAPQYFHGLDRVLGINCQFISANRSQQTEFIDYIVKIMSDVRSRRNTILHFNKNWHENQKNGFKIRLNGFSHNDLKPWFQEKNILIVSPGPSLKHVINQITDKCREKFTIVALAQSMPALAKYNLKPHFVLVVDPQDFSTVLDDWNDLSDINLIAEESVHLNFLNKNFQHIYTVVTNKDSMGLHIAFDVKHMDLEGGTASLAACSLASQLAAKSITLVGQDLSISKGTYFVSGTLVDKEIIKQDNNEFIKYKDKTNGFEKEVRQQVIPVLGWNNENLLTSPEYSVYLGQFEIFAQQVEDIKLYNASIGGANIKGFQNVFFNNLINELPNNIPISAPTATSPGYNYHDHREFLLETGKSISDVLLPIRKAMKILERKNREQENKLNSLDELERNIISISKHNRYINSIVSDAVIRLNRAVHYVTKLNENLDLSLKFYRELNTALTMYKVTLDYAIRATSHYGKKANSEKRR